MAQHRRLSWLLMISLLLAAPPALSTITGVRYSGFVDYLDNPNAGFPINVALNDPFILTFYFDTSVADSLPADPTNGRYVDAISLFSVQIGNDLFSSVSERNGVVQEYGNVISVTQGGDIPTYYQVGNAYQAGASAFMPGGIQFTAGVTLWNHGGFPGFASDALPAGPVAPDDWLHNTLAMSFWDPHAGGRTIFGYAQTAAFAPVPIPAALWLLGSALGVLGWVRPKSATA